MNSPKSSSETTTSQVEVIDVDAASEVEVIDIDAPSQVEVIDVDDHDCFSFTPESKMTTFLNLEKTRGNKEDIVDDPVAKMPKLEASSELAKNDEKMEDLFEEEIPNLEFEMPYTNSIEPSKQQPLPQNPNIKRLIEGFKFLPEKYPASPSKDIIDGKEFIVKVSETITTMSF